MSSSQEKKCGKCSKSLKNKATFKAEYCSHSFHISCITGSVCPICQPLPKTTNVFQHSNTNTYNTNVSQQISTTSNTTSITTYNSTASSQYQQPITSYNNDVVISQINSQINNIKSTLAKFPVSNTPIQMAPLPSPWPKIQPEPQQFSDDDDPFLSDPSSSPSSTVGGSGLEKVTIKAIPERDALAFSESLSQFTVLIGLKAPPLPSPDQRAPVDLVTVLDVSGSMKGAKLDLVKRAVHFVIDELGPSDRLSVVSFNDHAKRVFRLAGMTEAGRKDAKLAVDSLYATGGTSILEGLKKGARVLGERRYKNPIASIIFLSDGNDSYNDPSTLEYLRRLPPLIYPGDAGVPQQDIETIPVHSFGFGSDYDPVKMHAISDASGGTFSFIESYEMVQGAFASCIGGLLSVVTQELRLSLKSASKGVGIKSIPSGRYKSEITNRRTKGLIKVGDLYADEEKEFLINLSIPAQKTSLLDIVCSYRDVVSKKESMEIESVEIRRVNKVLPADVKVKVEVDRQKNRLIAADSIAEAQKMAETGDVKGARTLLEKSRTDIVKSESAQAGDELCVWLEEDMKETERRMGSVQQYNEEGRAYALSGISSHGAQRATTKGKSNGGRYNPYSTRSMALMVVKAEQVSDTEDDDQITVKKEK